MVFLKRNLNYSTKVQITITSNQRYSIEEFTILRDYAKIEKGIGKFPKGLPNKKSFQFTAI